MDAHEQEAIAFFKTFPDQHLINNPYKIMLAQGGGKRLCPIRTRKASICGGRTFRSSTHTQARYIIQRTRAVNLKTLWI